MRKTRDTEKKPDQGKNYAKHSKTTNSTFSNSSKATDPGTSLYSKNPATRVTMMSSDYDKPFDLLGDLFDNTVVIHRRDGTAILGTLHAFDHHINLSLTDVTIYPEAVDAPAQETEDRFFQRGGEVVDLRPVDGDGDG